VRVHTGIVHKRNSTVLDKVANQRFATPSKVIYCWETVIRRRAAEALASSDAIVQTARQQAQAARRAVDQAKTIARQAAQRQVHRGRALVSSTSAPCDTGPTRPFWTPRTARAACCRASAGRSGEKLCDHWVLKFSDWTDPHTQHRHLTLIPLWRFAQPLAEVRARRRDIYSFYGRLQTLDRRVGHPFAWYFYMLHGNRVHEAAGERVIEGPEAGLIVMEEHDYQVLRAWRARPYGF
jgi:hypothetical protein